MIFYTICENFIDLACFNFTVCLKSAKQKMLCQNDAVSLRLGFPDILTKLPGFGGTFGGNVGIPGIPKDC